MKTTPGNLWGDQYPFERNAAQRAMTMLGLAGLFVVTTILLVRTEPAHVLGIALICAGVLSGLAALSRHRYVQETRLGFVILRSRGGGFVFGSALVFAVIGVLVALLLVFD
ncbi:hypothetical protein GR927_43595 [Mycolicibacterium sp. 3033]|nr:hypothetical protein [Mycolicibacterium aurantiacum]